MNLIDTLKPQKVQNHGTTSLRFERVTHCISNWGLLVCSCTEAYSVAVFLLWNSLEKSQSVLNLTTRISLPSGWRPVKNCYFSGFIFKGSWNSRSTSFRSSTIVTWPLCRVETSVQNRCFSWFKFKNSRSTKLACRDLLFLMPSCDDVIWSSRTLTHSVPE